VILLVTRAAIGALLGAAVSVTAALFLYQYHSTVHLEMDRDVPSMVTGLYGTERVGDHTYAWSRRDVSLHLPGLNRSQPWACLVIVRGGRADEATLPDVVVTLDGVIQRRVATTNEYQHITFDIPSQSSPGAVVGLHVTNTFEPSAEDRRALGVMIDRWTCAPEAGHIVPPPARVSRAAVILGAAFGGAVVLMGASWATLLVGMGILGLGLAVPLTVGAGPFNPALDLSLWVGVAGAAVVALVGGVWRWTGMVWSAEARLAITWTIGVVVVKLLVLLHPMKAIIDAVFHAHRVLWVLDGRYFFTQTMPSGVEFPYAIGLYVVAAPWAALTSDLVSVLRIIIVVAEATGGLLLYLLVAHGWRDRQTAVVAAVLFSVVPLPFVIIGNANMTNVFAQALALASVAAAIRWPLQPRDLGPMIGFTAITAAALLSHISTLTLLAVTLGLLAVLYWWRGDRTIRASAAVILGGSAVAGLIAVVTYYIHFLDAFQSALTMRAAGGPSSGDTPVGLLERLTEAGTLIVAGLGWPLLALAALGALAFWHRPWRDRLDLGVLAWLATAVVCIGLVVATPVDRPFLRYAAEFISRVLFTTAPGVVMLAALGATGLWRRGGVWSWVAGLAVGGALVVGVDQWLAWLR